MSQHTPSFPQGILFDMDGVLLVTTQRPDQSWQRVCQQFASTLNLPPDVLFRAVQESRSLYKQDIEQDAAQQRRDRLEPFATRHETVQRALASLHTGDAAVAAQMVHAYETLRNQHRQPAPSARETLQKLRDAGIPLALVSNGNASYQRQKIQHAHLAPFFTAILIEEECGVAKPDPRIFHSALDQLHIRAHEAWMVGDDLVLDIAGAQRVGIVAIWCDASHAGLPQTSPVRPDRVIHTLPELLSEEHIP